MSRFNVGDRVELLCGARCGIRGNVTRMAEVGGLCDVLFDDGKERWCDVLNLISVEPATDTVQPIPKTLTLEEAIGWMRRGREVYHAASSYRKIGLKDGKFVREGHGAIGLTYLDGYTLVPETYDGYEALRRVCEGKKVRRSEFPTAMIELNEDGKVIWNDGKVVAWSKAILNSPWEDYED